MWNERYADADLVWSAEPNVFLPTVASALTPGSALDVACGEGRNAIWLAREGWDVTATDFSAVAVEKGRTLAGDTPVEWIVADATTFETPHTFDLVLMFYLHLDGPSFTAALERSLKAVAPGGTVFAVGHAVRNVSDGFGGPQLPDILWDTQSFENQLDGFTVHELGERLRSVPDTDVDAIDFVLHATRTEA